MFVLGDVFVGNFQRTQNFGENKERYFALYKLSGHNGIDFACPTGTSILSTADGEVTEIGIESLGTFDSGGYGRYIKIKHNGFLSLYGHLNDIVVKKGDHVVSGQLIAHSNNTGNSSGPHLHFGIAPCDANGAKTETSNGFSGYIDPLGDRCHWEVKNLTEPVVPGGNDSEATIVVKLADFQKMVPESTSYKVVASYLVDKGMNGWLAANGRTIIDLVNNPADPVGGESCTLFIAEALNELRDAQNRVKELEQQVKDNQDMQAATVAANIASHIETLPQDQKASLLSSLLKNVKDFVFVGGAK